MRATIIVDDNTVAVDGHWADVDCADLAAEGQHAVQWYGSYGEVEFRTEFDPERKVATRAPNEVITDFAPYEPYIDAWRVAYLKKLADEAARKVQSVGEAP